MEVELLNKILEKIEHLDQGLSSLRNEMNEKFDKLDARFDGMDARLDGIEVRLDSLEVRLDSLEVRLDSMEVRLDSLEVRLDSLEVRLDSMETAMQRIETRQEEDIHSILILINTKLEDTATKDDVASLRQDIEFNIRENSLFKLELDRIKRNSYD